MLVINFTFFNPLYLGNINEISKLVKRNKYLLGMCDSFGKTPLHRAVQTDNQNTLQIIKLLLDSHSDINAQDKTGNLIKIIIK
jgi:ankyrin repeat protein